MVSEQVAVIGLHESAKAQSCASNMTNSQNQANVMPNITGSRSFARTLDRSGKGTSESCYR
ncbi:MAG: hypothetical protein WAK17_00385 [Candidatus Nitrosopolaris sp.]